MLDHLACLSHRFTLPHVSLMTHNPTDTRRRFRTFLREIFDPAQLSRRRMGRVPL